MFRILDVLRTLPNMASLNTFTEKRAFLETSVQYLLFTVLKRLGS